MVGAIFIFAAILIAAIKTGASANVAGDAFNELLTGEPAEHERPGCANEIGVMAVVVILFVLGGIMLGGIVL